jgi:hypothetical protein
MSWNLMNKGTLILQLVNMIQRALPLIACNPAFECRFEPASSIEENGVSMIPEARILLPFQRPAAHVLNTGNPNGTMPKWGAWLELILDTMREPEIAECYSAPFPPPKPTRSLRATHLPRTRTADTPVAIRAAPGLVS